MYDLNQIPDDYTVEETNNGEIQGIISDRKSA